MSKKLSTRLKRIVKLLKYVFPGASYDDRRRMAIDNFEVKKGNKVDFFDTKDRGNFFDAKKEVKE